MRTPLSSALTLALLAAVLLPAAAQVQATPFTRLVSLVETQGKDGEIGPYEIGKIFNVKPPSVPLMVKTKGYMQSTPDADETEIVVRRTIFVFRFPDTGKVGVILLHRRHIRAAKTTQTHMYGLNADGTVVGGRYMDRSNPSSIPLDLASPGLAASEHGYQALAQYFSSRHQQIAQELSASK